MVRIYTDNVLDYTGIQHFPFIDVLGYFLWVVHSPPRRDLATLQTGEGAASGRCPWPWLGLPHTPDNYTEPHRLSTPHTSKYFSHTGQHTRHCRHCRDGCVAGKAPRPAPPPRTRPPPFVYTGQLRHGGTRLLLPLCCAAVLSPQPLLCLPWCVGSPGPRGGAPRRPRSGGHQHQAGHGEAHTHTHGQGGVLPSPTHTKHVLFSLFLLVLSTLFLLIFFIIFVTQELHSTRFTG